MNLQVTGWNGTQLATVLALDGSTVSRWRCVGVASTEGEKRLSLLEDLLTSSGKRIPVKPLPGLTRLRTRASAAKTKTNAPQQPDFENEPAVPPKVRCEALLSTMSPPDVAAIVRVAVHISGLPPEIRKAFCSLSPADLHTLQQSVIP